MTSLAVIVLKTGEYLISETDQLEYEPKVHLISPYLLGGKTKLTLSRWPLHTDDEHVLLHSDSVLTVVEPKEDIVKLYLAKVGKEIETFTSEPQPVTLTEDYQIQDDDEYEPRYIEE